MRTADAASDAPRLSGETIFRTVLLVTLLVFAAAAECWKLSSLADPEIWGHLRAGTWMLESHAWPQSALFSQVGNTPWRDLSWGYDLLTAIAHRFAGLAAVPALLMLFRIALAAITFLLAGGWRNFWTAIVLSAIVQYILFAMGPVAMFVSLLFFGMELLLLLEVRESGNPRSLYTLSFLFLLWVNFDVGFVYGVALLLVFTICVFLEQRSKARNLRWLDQPHRQIPLKTACATLGVSFLACLVNPYTWHPFVSFFQSEFSRVNRNLPGYTAMGFRHPQEYVLMLMGMAASLALGLLRSRDLFRIGVLIGSSVLAFYARRDNWMLALVSVAVIGRAILQSRASDDAKRISTWSWQQLVPCGIAVALAFAIFEVRVPKGEAALLSHAAQTLPVRAADFLHQHPQPAPLFNTYLWGEFLSWYLPEYPVAIDARRGLYSEQEELDYFKVMNAEIPYQAYPPMSNARTFLLDKAATMGEAFRGVTGFRVIYEDEISIVYSREANE